MEPLFKRPRIVQYEKHAPPVVEHNLGVGRTEQCLGTAALT
jgi:hypothetical protein